MLVILDFNQKWIWSTEFGEKIPKIKSDGNLSSGTPLTPRGQDETNTCVLQLFCE
jgi:hypothetical protein